MEPLSILGVAANVIQVVDVSARLLSNIKQVSKSATGDVKSNQQIRDTTQKLSTFNSRLLDNLNETSLKRELTVLEHELVDLSTNCNDIITDLFELLDGVSAGRTKQQEMEDGLSKLSVESRLSDNEIGNNRLGKWDSIKGGIKAMWKEKTVEKVLQRLNDARQQLATSILINLQ